MVLHKYLKNLLVYLNFFESVGIRLYNENIFFVLDNYNLSVCCKHTKHHTKTPPNTHTSQT